MSLISLGSPFAGTTNRRLVEAPQIAVSRPEPGVFKRIEMGKVGLTSGAIRLRNAVI